ncbi:MAG TPA: thiol:disulfide interchange protein DsbA/DsbL [Steroidobacteraceae bacterium]|nr:thiol:disulfide interchange protein DsbA/DsbL [Steroidobacteraceae bacterium]
MNRVLPLLAAILALSWAANAGARAPEPAASANTAASTLAKWKAGTNYKLVGNPQPTSVASGKVEVSEVFWYGCGHCYALDPELETWKKSKPEYVEFVRVPVIWGPQHRQHAKLYYTLQVLRRPELHSKVFEAIHQQGAPLTGRSDMEARVIHFAFLNREGVSAKDFDAAYDSMTVASNMLRAEQLSQNLAVSSVPMMFVNNKFSTSVTEAGGTAEMLALVNDLAASEKNR